MTSIADDIETGLLSARISSLRDIHEDPFVSVDEYLQEVIGSVPRIPEAEADD